MATAATHYSPEFNEALALVTVERTVTEVPGNWDGPRRSAWSPTNEVDAAAEQAERSGHPAAITRP